uniref:Putative secreted protein n=1 Tax=Anopheles marajoara TaxID=58244 RepID=A0A2M4CC00_9DIPT
MAPMLSAWLSWCYSTSLRTATSRSRASSTYSLATCVPTSTRTLAAGSRNAYSTLVTPSTKPDSCVMKRYARAPSSFTI